MILVHCYLWSSGRTNPLVIIHHLLILYTNFNQFLRAFKFLRIEKNILLHLISKIYLLKYQWRRRYLTCSNYIGRWKKNKKLNSHTTSYHVPLKYLQNMRLSMHLAEVRGMGLKSDCSRQHRCINEEVIDVETKIGLHVLRKLTRKL